MSIVRHVCGNPDWSCCHLDQSWEIFASQFLLDYSWSPYTQMCDPLLLGPIFLCKYAAKTYCFDRHFCKWCYLPGNILVQWSKTRISSKFTPIYRSQKVIAAKPGSDSADSAGQQYDVHHPLFLVKQSFTSFGLHWISIVSKSPLWSDQVKFQKCLDCSACIDLQCVCDHVLCSPSHISCWIRSSSSSRSLQNQTHYEHLL